MHKAKKNWVDVVTNQKQFSCQQIHHFINCLIYSKPNTIWHLLRLVYINRLYLLRKWSGTCLHTNKYVKKLASFFEGHICLIPLKKSAQSYNSKNQGLFAISCTVYFLSLYLSSNGKSLYRYVKMKFVQLKQELISLFLFC